MNKMIMPRISKQSILLITLIIILTLCLIYMEDITKYFNRLSNKLGANNDQNIINDKFSNITGYDNRRGKYAGIEGFQNNNTNLIDPTKTITINDDITADTSMNKTSERNYKVAIEPKTRSIKIEFQEVSDGEVDEGIKKLGYLLILAKYNNRLEKIGHVDAKISKEGVDIESYILENSVLFPSEDKKEELRTHIRNVFTKTASDTLKLSMFNSLIGVNSVNNKLKSKDAMTSEDKKILKAYLDLLEIIYDAKYYKRALNVIPESTYSTGIYNLYDDLVKVVDLSETPTPTPTPYSSDVVIKDAKYDLIQQNALDADEIASLEQQNVLEEIKGFLGKYIKKYKSLTMSVGDEKIGNGICNRDGICSYTFENLEDKDANGEFYYYKLGFGLIYNKGIGSYTEEVSQIYSYKYGPGNDAMYFKLDNTLEEQTRLLKRLAEIEKAGVMTSGTKVTQPMVKEDGSQDMDAYMKMLRPHLGNYPSEFTLREQDVRDLSLADYLNKSVNSGTINIGVNIKDTPVYDDTKPSIAEVTD